MVPAQKQAPDKSQSYLDQLAKITDPSLAGPVSSAKKLVETRKKIAGETGAAAAAYLKAIDKNLDGVIAYLGEMQANPKDKDKIIAKYKPSLTANRTDLDSAKNAYETASSQAPAGPQTQYDWMVGLHIQLEQLKEYKEGLEQLKEYKEGLDGITDNSEKKAQEESFTALMTLTTMIAKLQVNSQASIDKCESSKWISADLAAKLKGMIANDDFAGALSEYDKIYGDWNYGYAKEPEAGKKGGGTLEGIDKDQKLKLYPISVDAVWDALSKFYGWANRGLIGNEVAELAEASANDHFVNVINYAVKEGIGGITKEEADRLMKGELPENFSKKLAILECMLEVAVQRGSMSYVEEAFGKYKGKSADEVIAALAGKGGVSAIAGEMTYDGEKVGARSQKFWTMAFDRVLAKEKITAGTSPLPQGQTETAPPIKSVLSMTPAEPKQYAEQTPIDQLKKDALEAKRENLKNYQMAGMENGKLLYLYKGDFSGRRYFIAGYDADGDPVYQAYDKTAEFISRLPGTPTAPQQIVPPSAQTTVQPTQTAYLQDTYSGFQHFASDPRVIAAAGVLGLNLSKETDFSPYYRKKDGYSVVKIERDARAILNQVSAQDFPEA
jgi:hypothetical protein